jgi:hypothetical protein
VFYRRNVRRVFGNMMTTATPSPSGYQSLPSTAARMDMFRFIPYQVTYLYLPRVKSCQRCGEGGSRREPQNAGDIWRKLCGPHSTDSFSAGINHITPQGAKERTAPWRLACPSSPPCLSPVFGSRKRGQYWKLSPVLSERGHGSQSGPVR